MLYVRPPSHWWQGGTRMRIVQLWMIVSVLCSAAVALATTNPDPSITPGALCTSRDPDFMDYDYPSHVARCKRHVNTNEKEAVAKAYGGIPKSQWKKYEFDHLIPLCAGGANTPDNLWPQPIDEAKDKDQIEDQVCQALKNGQMSQQQAVDEIWAWFEDRYHFN